MNAARNNSIELLRVFSAVAIIWFHSKAPGQLISYSGLSVFIIITVLFLMDGQGRREYSVRRIFESLVRPWIFWVIFFAIINLLRGRSAFPYGDGPFSRLLSGSSIHLWYLPFMVIVVSVVYFFKGFLNKRFLFWSAVVAAASLSFSVGYWEPYSHSLGYPFPQYIQALMAVFIGMALGLRGSVVNSRAALLFLLMCLAFSQLLYPFNSVGIPNLIAFAAVSCAFLFKSLGVLNVAVQSVARLTFGVYLIHPLFISFAVLIFANPELWFARVLLAIGLSFLSVWFYKFAAKYVLTRISAA